MHSVMSATSQPIAGDRPVKRRRRLPRGPFDRRTRIARRRDALVKTFTAQLADEVTPALALKIVAAAELVALAERYRGQFMSGASDVPLDDLIRLERLSSTAVRSLGLQHRAQLNTQTLSDYLRCQGEGKGST